MDPGWLFRVIQERKDVQLTPPATLKLDMRVGPAVSSKKPIHLNGLKDFGEQDGAINHFRNFINAVLGKEKVIAPPDVGQQAAISGHMATLSFKHQKKIVWDDKANNYHFA